MPGSAASAGSSSIASASASDAALDLLAPRAERLDLGGDAARLVVARREQQREREVGLVEAAGRVDARREAEGDVLARGRRRRAAGDLGERARAGPAAACRGAASPARTSGAVVAVERRDVADGADGDEVEPPAQVELHPELARARPRAMESASPTDARPLYAKPHSGRCGLRNASAGSGASGTRWWSMTTASIARAAHALEPLVVARAAVARDEERRARVEDARERGPESP